MKTKSLIRETIWFPGIDKMVEDAVTNCSPCQAATNSHSPQEPLQMTHLPEHTWLEVSIDMRGPFPTGEYLLVVMDDYSRFPEVEIINSTSTRAVLPKLLDC